MTPRRLAELEKGERRRAALRAVIAVALAWIVLAGLYYLVPAGRVSDASAFVRLGIGIALFAAVLAGQARQITRAELPELRAVQALGVILPLFLVVFAVIYLSVSHASASAFSQHLDHTSALYFTITVFSTVGFGDITPATDLARIIVSIQMLLDLVLIGAVVRLLVRAARTGLARTGTGPSDQP
jgi:voltage-gated potassium channel